MVDHPSELTLNALFMRGPRGLRKTHLCCPSTAVLGEGPSCFSSSWGLQALLGLWPHHSGLCLLLHVSPPLLSKPNFPLPPLRRTLVIAVRVPQDNTGSLPKPQSHLQNPSFLMRSHSQALGVRT